MICIRKQIIHIQYKTRKTVQKNIVKYLLEILSRLLHLNVFFIHYYKKTMQGEP